MIEIKNLYHSLGQKLVLSDISLSIPDNCILGVVGINGAGKSTLLRLLSGVYHPTGGSILYDGRSPSIAAVRNDIFFLPDDPYFTTYTTPIYLFDFYKTLYPSINKEVFEALLSRYSIKSNGYLRNFSKGMRRQVFIALALAIKPKYLLLDESFDGLDPLSRKIFKDAIIAYVEEYGATVIISSHSLRELEDFCDKFILINNNKIKKQGDISQHVEQFCKFELAFKDKVDEKMFDGLPVKHISVRERFVTIVLLGDSGEMRTRLEALSPAVIDETLLSFEEVFIYDVEENRGDLNEK